MLRACRELVLGRPSGNYGNRLAPLGSDADCIPYEEALGLGGDLRTTLVAEVRDSSVDAPYHG